MQYSQETSRERERVRVQFRRARIQIVLSVFSLIACFFLYYSCLRPVSSSSFEKREHHCRDDYFLKRRFVRQGIRTTDCCGCSDKQPTSCLFSVTKAYCNHKGLPQCDAHYNSVPSSSSPLFPPLPLPVCIPPSFFLYTPAPLCQNILFLPRLLLIVAALSVEHAAEIMNDVRGVSCLSGKILSSPVDKRRIHSPNNGVPYTNACTINICTASVRFCYLCVDQMYPNLWGSIQSFLEGLNNI